MNLYNLSCVIVLTLLNRICFGLLTQSSCFNQERVFIYNDERLTFDNAQLACETQNANLVKIDNIEVFNFIIDFAVNDIAQNKAFWVGLSRDIVANQEIADDPLSFSFVDGTTFVPDGFGSQRSVFPWEGGTPNDNFTEAVGVRVRFNGLVLNDLALTFELDSICETTCPPTSSPTLNPTKSPTSSPTFNPTLTPTIFVEEEVVEGVFLSNERVTIGFILLFLLVFVGFLAIFHHFKVKELLEIQLNLKSLCCV